MDTTKMEIIEVTLKPKIINRCFLEDAQVLEARWNKTGLLKGVRDKFIRQVIAVMLENQRLMNEQK